MVIEGEWGKDLVGRFWGVCACGEDDDTEMVKVCKCVCVKMMM